ncbi:MAG: GNAT family N-acetyltransferase [Vicinamibacterales bacterium]
MTIAETPRLHIRRIEPGDAGSMFDVYGDETAMRWVGDGRALTLAQCEEWVEVTRRNYDERGYGMFAIARRDTGQTIGFIGLVHPGGHPTPELKYALRRDAWNKGYATEAARAMLRHAVALGLREVIATVSPGNGASMAVLLKSGMTTGGLRVDDDGEYTQVFVWRSLAR